MKNHSLSDLCVMWNEATAPYVLRTDEEHHRQSQLARAIRNRISRLGYRWGTHYYELSDGSLFVCRED
jgi:hypothetical protein